MNDNEAEDEDGNIVIGEKCSGFHGTDSPTFDVIVANGLPDDGGTDRNLGRHVRQMGGSAFRGLGPVPGQGGIDGFACPVQFAGVGGTVVEIRGVYGWNTQLHARRAVSQLPGGEAEIAILRLVPRQHIVRLGSVVMNSRGLETVKVWREV